MSEKKTNGVGIVAKLVEVLLDLGPIQKDKRNTHFGYNYVGEGQVMAELRGRLASRGIFVFTSVETCVPEYGEGGKAGVYVNVTTRHRFVDSITGETCPPMSEPALGGAGLGWDSGDKGVYKAITGAVKYFLMKQFLITDEQDPEAGEQAGRAPEPGKQPAGEKHRRTREYEEETGKGDKKVANDLVELDAFLLQHEIPPGFLVSLLQEKGLIDGRTKTLDTIKPGILRRVLAPASKANLLKAWAAQQADESSHETPRDARQRAVEDDSTETKVVPRSKMRETAPAKNRAAVRTNEGDQTREGSRRTPAKHGEDPNEIMGDNDWRQVKIHFGDKKGTPLGKLPRNSLVWWIENWVAKPFRKTWEPDTVLLDCALCQAADELAGEAK